MAQIIIALAVLSAGVFAGTGDHYRMQTYLALIALTALLYQAIARKVDWSAAAAFVAAAIGGLRVFANPTSPFASFGGHSVTAFDSLAAASTAILCICAVSVLLADWRDLRRLRRAFMILALIDAAWLIVNWIFPVHPVGVFDNHSIDGAFLGMVFPLFAFRGRRAGRRIPCCILLLAAMLVCDSNTAIAELAVGLLAWGLLQKFRRPLYYFQFAAIVCAVLFGLGALVLGNHFLNSTGRFDAWAIVMKYWYLNTSHLFGAGLGTFFMYGPRILMATSGFPIGVTPLWMHNDWLQILFELGAIGLAAAAILFWHALSRAYELRQSYLFAAIAVYGTGMLTQMPLHHTLLATYGALLIRLAFL